MNFKVKPPYLILIPLFIFWLILMVIGITLPPETTQREMYFFVIFLLLFGVGIVYLLPRTTEIRITDSSIFLKVWSSTGRGHVEYLVKRDDILAVTTNPKRYSILFRVKEFKDIEIDGRWLIELTSGRRLSYMETFKAIKKALKK